MSRLRVLIVQEMCKQYRAPLYARMHEELAADGIDLQVAYSEPPEAQRRRNDDVELPAHYGLKLPRRTLLGDRVVWQMPLGAVRRADLVIVEHALKHAINYPLLALSRLGLKRVAMWFHGGSLRHGEPSLGALLRRWSLLGADWVFAYTRGAAAAAVALGAPSGRVTPLGNAIDLASFRKALSAVSTDDLAAARLRLDLPADAEVAIFCGSLYPGRGVEFLLDACDLVARTNQRFHLILVGSGPLAGKLREAQNCKPWLHSLGSIFGDERAVYFRLSSICLMPYLAGLGILDAMAAGLPFLVTGARATNPEIEYLIDGVTGLVTGDSVKQFADAVLELLADTPGREAMSEAARAASLEYSIESMAANFCKGIRQCLAGPRHGVLHFAGGELRSRMPPTVAVLLTCFNRREKTLESLRALKMQTVSMPRSLKVILLDDASSDGTAAAVRKHHPEVEMLHGDGTLFWCGGMRRAFARAQQIGFDYYLLLNDDTVLAPHCLDTMLRTAKQLEEQRITAIVTAAICDPVSGRRSYGGMRREYRWDGVHDRFLEPDPEKPLPCDTMNGNCTLIPAAITTRLGNLESRFTQQFGDYDYGFRARKAGFKVYIAPGYLGTCSNNPTQGTWRDTQLPLARRWKLLMGPKGTPPAEWLLFSRRHYGYLWPFYFASPYLKVGLSLFVPRAASR